MSETTEYNIGAEVTCSEGVCGDLSRVVIDPVARVVTHLVVEPRHHRGLGRLVPVDLVDPGAAGIGLRCGAAEFEALEDAEETRFMLDASEQTGYADGEVFSWPYYGLGSGMGGGMGMGGIGGASSPPVITYDRLPVGEVDVRRGDQVHATDGNIGRIQGLVIDPRDHHVTHVLLQEGHLWGKKDVAIPIGAVANVADGVTLNLTRDQVRDLPPVDLDDRR
jgi:sporulation protein YlmC with PRC-barrel domain